MTEERQMTTKDSHLFEVHKNLKTMITEKASAMPADFNQTRFIQNCMAVLQETRDIGKYEPISVCRTLIKGAFLGLDFFSRECYAIPYGNQLNFQTDYKGEIKLVKKYSINPVQDFYAKLIRDGDFFEEGVENGRQTVTFKPIPLNDGKIIGAFAVCLFKDGSMLCEAMSSKEIEEVRRNYSKQSQGMAWVKSLGEMYKKTVSRRLCKHISLQFDSIEQKKTFDESADMDFNKKQTIHTYNMNACSSCNDEIEEKTAEESNKKYLKPLCTGCQK